MSRLIDEIAYMTAIEAAELLHTTPMLILRLIKQRALTGTMFDGEWLVTSGSVLAWQAAPSEEKQQHACASSCSGCNCS